MANAVRYLVCLVGLCVALGRARADAPPLDVSGVVDGVPLAPHATVLEDPSGTLAIADVARREAAFHALREALPSFGLSRSVYWFRLRFVSHASTPQRVFVEVAYPHLDHLTLYTEDGRGGFTAKHSGDALPFAKRDVAYGNVIFSLQHPARAERTYYLRVASDGSVAVPLVAWTRHELVGHQVRTWLLYGMFYGALALMAAYAVGVFALASDREHLYYAVYLGAALLSTFSLAGHLFQFVLPNAPALSQRVTLASPAAIYLSAALLVRAQLMRGTGLHRLVSAGAWFCGFAIAGTLFFPYDWGLALLIFASLAVALVAAAVIARLGRHEARLFALSFSLPLIGALLTLLHQVGALPSSALVQASLPLGISAQIVLIATGLGDKVTRARATVEALKGSLEQKVEQVSVALDRARDASTEAERAALARRRFMDTISHELRTPLNPIINIPEGLRADFVLAPHADCGACHSEFRLEQGEVLDEHTVCPECGQAGALVRAERLAFEGCAAEARQLLERVERSGYALLQVVNGVLEFSRLEAGHAELTLTSVRVAELVRAAVQHLHRQKPRERFRVTVSVGEDVRVRADGERLTQVFQHLLHNAVKFSEGAAEIEVSATRTGSELMVSVADRGIGIAPADLERIFDGFEQVSRGPTRRFGGTGLGLAICRRLVVAHGGRIWAESDGVRGTRLCFTLPAPAASERDPLAECG